MSPQGRSPDGTGVPTCADHSTAPVAAQAGYPDLTGFGEPGIPGFWLKASKTTCAELYVAFAARNEAAVNKATETAKVLTTP